MHGVLAVCRPGARDALPAREAELLPLLAAEAAVTIHRIAVWDGAETAEALTARADAALYEAKGAGRARAVTAA